jgi:hypothetical protein
MAIKIRSYRFIIPFVLFVCLGIYGSFSVDFLQSDKALKTAFRYFIAPILIIGGYLGYISSFGDKRNLPFWRNLLGLLAITFVCMMVLLISIQGYLVLYNCNIGPQKKIIIKGEIIKLKYPKSKKLLNNYVIEIKEDNNFEVIKIDVPTKDYILNQDFKKEMTLGSLGFLYSRN